MQNKINNKWQWLIFLLLNILLPLRMAFAAGGIATDGTVGPAQNLSGLKIDIEQKLGTTVGKNLFHSFEQFNVNNGQTVTFRENTPNALDNVISRVTGGSRSDINGTLSSTPGGHANLYLVNPSGIVFGKNAQINVPGAFHASTADEVRFQDGAKFSVSQPAGSTLTAAAPASFGFLGTSSATNGLLKVDGAQLAVGAGKKLDMVGRNISVDNGAKLSASEGEVRLEAVGTGSMSIPVTQPSETAHGTLALTRSTIDASGEGGGKVIIRGSDLKMDQNALIAANTHGKQDGAGIDILLTDDLNMKGGGRILAGTLGSGAAGNIHIKAKNLLIDGKTTINGQPLYLGTGISTEAGDHTATEKHSTGRAGDVELHIANRLSLVRGGQINSSSFSTGDAGNVMIKAGQLWIDRQGILAPLDILGRSLHSGIVTATLRTWSGKGGNINVAVQGDINMKGGGLIEAGTLGNAISGNILVIAKNLRIDGLNTITGIGTEAGNSAAKEKHSTGRAGNIEVRIEDQLLLARSGQINASSFGTGDAGNVTVNAEQLLIDGQGAQNTGIFSSAAREWSGKGGNIDVAVQGDINMKGGGSLIQAGTSGRGDSGKILVTAKNLSIDGLNTVTGIGTETGSSSANEEHSTGRAGDIELRIGNKLLLTRSGQINASSFGTGDAGNITVKAGQLLIDGQGAQNLFQTGIFTDTARTWSGQGGNINVKVQDRINLQRGRISASTAGAGTGKGGTIDLNTKYLSLTEDGMISTISLGSRNAGSINIHNADDIELKDGGEINANTLGGGDAGDIYVKAKNLSIDGQTSFNGHTPTRIASVAGLGKIPNEKTGNAGKITVDIADRLSLTGGGQIGASSFGEGNAGSVEINAGQLLIDTQGVLPDNSGNLLETGIFTAAIGTWSGKGGDITVNVQGNMDINGGGLISAIADGNQPAGSIVVNSQRDINLRSGSEIIASTRGNGAAGDITVSANQLTLDQKSLISTEADNSNGGNITINGGQFVQLINSGLKTSVQGLQGNSGNIRINAENLVMETGLIQANTEAFGGSAGSINLNIKGLIPSGQSLFKGVIQETPWAPDVFGLNVIEAVAPNGISGLVQSTAPQLDLSGVLSNLGMPQFDTRAISQDYCSLGTGSSLIRQGKGGLPSRSRDSILY